MYCLSSTTTEDLRMICSVSIVGCLQSVASTQTSEFKAILNQQVQAWMTHLAADYKRLNGETGEFRRLVMEMRSHMGGTCVPSYSPHGSDEDPPPPCLTMPLF
ncbi:hypothetical protein Peur_032102 [Populus x canadensis]